MDMAALQALSPDVFETAASGYRTLSDMAGQAKDDLENGVSAKMRAAGLAGMASEAAHLALHELEQNYHYVQVECGLVDVALRALAGDFRSARKLLTDALADAESCGFTVGSDGSVGYPPLKGGDDGTFPGGTVHGNGANRHRTPLPGVPLSVSPPVYVRLEATMGPLGARAQSIADRIDDALTEATAADEKWAAHLRMLTADDDLTVSAADWDNVGQDTTELSDDTSTLLASIPPPPTSGDVQKNALWWKSLSPQEQDEYLTMYPSVVGAMDGLPSDVRDEANRTVLDETRGKYQSELDAMPPEPDDGSVDHILWKTKHDQLTGALNGMNAIEDRFDRTGTNGLPEAYLLGFDPVGQGDGNVILANGNPDTADHVAVIVPGTTTNISGIGGNINSSVNLWQASAQQAPGAKVSTISWFNYNAPNNIYWQAPQDQYAHAGAPALQGFMDGSREAHLQATGGQTAHTTIIGHSYGSTLIGDTIKQNHDFPADDVIALGSPGMQADNVGQLGYTRDHFFAEGGGGSDNLVRIGGSAVGLGGDGNIPTSLGFGATVMDGNVPSHGDYFDMNPDGTPSQSLQNQAAVVTGNYGNVKKEWPY